MKAIKVVRGTVEGVGWGVIVLIIVAFVAMFFDDEPTAAAAGYYNPHPILD